MRRHKGARKAARAKVTRAQFVDMLVREVGANGGIKLHAPELTKKQPIAEASRRVSDAKRSDDGEPGIARGAGLTVKGAPATPDRSG